MNVIVVGAGSLGTWSALKLHQAGHRVTLIDAGGPGNSRASSGGETRVIRTVYGSDRIYVRMAHRSLLEWDQFQRRHAPGLMELIGSLWLCPEDDAYVRAAQSEIESLGLSIQQVPVEQARERWPQICFDGIASVYLESTAGFLRARRACMAVASHLHQQGVPVLQDQVLPVDLSNPVHQIQLGSGSRLNADAIVFACGPWLKSLFPELFGTALLVSRQEVYYFGVPAFCDPMTQKSFVDRFECGQLPIWLELAEPIYYGMPSIDGRGFKIARDERGAEFDPTDGDRRPTDLLVQQARQYLARRFPALAGAPLVESRTCQYTNTPDGHLVIDRHQPSGIIFAGGGCGHSFKLGPAVGDLVTELVSDSVSDAELLGNFRLDRLGEQGFASTQFDHA